MEFVAVIGLVFMIGMAVALNWSENKRITLQRQIDEIIEDLKAKQ